MQMHLVLLVLLLIGVTSVAGPQSRPGRPALIRDTDAAEGKEEAEPSIVKEYSPLMAEKNLKIGDFYFKKKNYVAAIERYKDAVGYQPNSPEAYQSLAKAHEKNGDRSKAAEAYREFIDKNPDSPKIAEFRSKLAKLEKK